MKNLLEYLDKYFGESSDGLHERMTDRFGVNVKLQRGLHLFKYDQISANWVAPLTHECRGIICRFRNPGWELISYPFDKFFNLHEPFCALREEDFKANPGGYQLVEKADGTCIQLYCLDGEWQGSTLGSVTGGGDDDPLNYVELFWETLEQVTNWTRDKFKEALVDKSTYVFELCTPRNRIVTKYPEKRIYLLGVRDFTHAPDSSRLLSHSELDVLAELLEVRRPEYEPMHSFADFAAINQYAEEHAELHLENDYREGQVEIPEGFVIWTGDRPIGKRKNKRYLDGHSIISGNDRETANNLVLRLFQDKLDDVSEFFDDRHYIGLEAMRDHLRYVNGEANRIASSIAEHEWTDPAGTERGKYAGLAMKALKELRKNKRIDKHQCALVQGCLMNGENVVSVAKYGHCPSVAVTIQEAHDRTSQWNWSYFEAYKEAYLKAIDDYDRR